MNYRIVSVLLLISIIFSVPFSGCGVPVNDNGSNDSGSNIIKPEEEVLESFDPALAGATVQFGIALLEKLLEKEENMLISPTSIATALAMTYNGARGETKEAMAEVLGVSGVELERLNENNQALLYLLQAADPSVKLQIANSLWMREGIEFDPEFVKRNEKYYNAVVQGLDFDSPEAAEAINQWVEEHTDGLIEDIIAPPIDPLTILFLINAIYFQGDWTEPFDVQDTRDDPFYLPDGKTKTVPFMHRSDDFDYYEEEGFQSVRLPYGEKERMAMYVFLPAQDARLQEFVREFDAEKWREWRQRFQQVEGDLYLPRFSMEYEKTLNEALKALGMETAFDANKADFFDMVPWEDEPRLFISEVKHKSFIEVNEKGTEAAAATSVEIRLESAPLFRFNMRVDRPFFFLIHDAETDTILFLGTVADPK